MPDSKYWQRLQAQRLSRRKLLGGAALAGAGAVVAAACGGGGGGEGGRTPSPAGSPTPTGGALEPVGPNGRGGTARYFGFDALPLDTRDPHQTQFGPMYAMHSVVFAKILSFDDEVHEVMRPDLSAAPDGGPGMPEQPDELTYIIRIRPNATWHDTPAIRANFPTLAGRPVTAEDVKYSIERQLNRASPRSALYYRRGHYENIDTMEVVDEKTLRIRMKSPLAPFLAFLADPNAAIVARETVDDNDEMNEDKRMVGAGPFMLDKMEPLNVVRVVRNPKWHAADDNPDGVGTGRPFLDAYEAIWTPQNDQVVEQAFKSKQIDSTGFDDENNFNRVRQELGEKVLYTRGVGTAGAVNSRIFAGGPPFNDPRARKAIHWVLDRHIMGQQLFGNRWRVNGPVAWPMVMWALPQDELLSRPGYRTGAEREQDIAEAKKLWDEATGGSVKSIKVVVAGIPAYIPDTLLPSIDRMLQETLGVKLDAEVDPAGYTRLGECLLANSIGGPGGCIFTLGYDNGWVDLDDWLYPYYHSQGTKNSFGFSDPELDRLLEQQREEFDNEKRREIGFEIQRRLLDDFVLRLDYISAWGESLRWPYFKNPPPPRTWFGYNHSFANTWLDKDDPSWSGRPA